MRRTPAIPASSPQRADEAEALEPGEDRERIGEERRQRDQQNGDAGGQLGRDEGQKREREGETQDGADKVQPEMRPRERRQLAPDDRRDQQNQPGAEGIPEHIGEVGRPGVAGDLVDRKQQAEIDAGDEEEEQGERHEAPQTTGRQRPRPAPSRVRPGSAAAAPSPAQSRALAHTSDRLGWQWPPANVMRPTRPASFAEATDRSGQFGARAGITARRRFREAGNARRAAGAVRGSVTSRCIQDRPQPPRPVGRRRPRS